MRLHVDIVRVYTMFGETLTRPEIPHLGAKDTVHKEKTLESLNSTKPKPLSLIV